MHQPDIASELLQMIGRVSASVDSSNAMKEMLATLLKIFNMDQAAVCEMVSADVRPLFAIDRTKKIITDPGQLWLSKTLMQSALLTNEPAIHSPNLGNRGDEIPRSVSGHLLKCVVCLPISRSPDRVVYLASQRDPLRAFSETELAQFRIAAQAGILAHSQHQEFIQLRETNRELQNNLSGKKESLLYSSSKMQALMEDLERLAPFNISVLIQGESGSGKEEVAKEIHRISKRSGKFVAINCANLTENLLESELFGYVRGAFTGANAPRKGLIQEAQGGTFFFDEITEIPINLQAKLLRTLQEKTLRPVGGNEDIPIDVRFLAASHAPLAQAVVNKKFREDLYYRVDEASMLVPPLRERPEDVELLANHFIEDFSRDFKMKPRALSAEALQTLLSHAWPGNVRELKNVCRSAIILSKGSVIQAEDIRINPVSSSKPVNHSDIDTKESERVSVAAPVDVGPLKEMTRQFEKDMIKRLMGKPGQNQVSVAKSLKVSVRTLQRILSDQPIDDEAEQFSSTGL